MVVEKTELPTVRAPWLLKIGRLISSCRKSRWTEVEQRERKVQGAKISRRALPPPGMRQTSAPPFPSSNPSKAPHPFHTCLYLMSLLLQDIASPL